MSLNIKFIERFFMFIIILVCSYYIIPFIVDFIFNTKMLNWMFKYIGLVITLTFIVGSIGLVFSIVKYYLLKSTKYLKILKLSLILVFISGFVFFIIATGLH